MSKKSEKSKEETAVTVASFHPIKRSTHGSTNTTNGFGQSKSLV